MMDVVEVQYTGEGMELVAPQAKTPRQRKQIERSIHHFTVPMYKLGDKPRLKCWCGETILLSDKHVETFVHEHEECTRKENV